LLACTCSHPGWLPACCACSRNNCKKSSVAEYIVCQLLSSSSSSSCHAWKIRLNHSCQSCSKWIMGYKTMSLLIDVGISVKLCPVLYNFGRNLFSLLSAILLLSCSACISCECEFYTWSNYFFSCSMITAYFEIFALTI